MSAAVHTLERYRRGRTIRRWLTWLQDAHRRWYDGEIARQRRAVEEDVRRLGGTVAWND